MQSPLASMSAVDEQLATRIFARLDRVEDELHRSVEVSDDLMQWTSRHLLDAGGKRIRPLVVMLGAAFGDIEEQAVLDAGALVELTHLASLYHDDVMDSAPTRRGAPSAHSVWGNSVAILTGDFLFARASALSARMGSHVVERHSRTFERLCIGQLHETVGPGADDDPFEHYLSVLSDKTASLIAVSGELGVISSGGAAPHAETMRRYGEKAGIAFQLADDVLDLRSDASTSGKKPGTDLREGIPTMPTLLVRRRHDLAPDRATSSLVHQLDSDLSSDRALGKLVSDLRDDPAIEEASAMATEYADAAIDILRELPECPARDILENFTTALVQRSA